MAYTKERSHYYQSPDVDPFVLDTLATSSTQSKHGFISRLTSHSVGIVVQSAMLDATKDRCLAQLTKTALEHTGTLAAMEAQLAAATPQSAGRYRAIVDAYTVRAIQRIVGGDGHGK